MPPFLALQLPFGCHLRRPRPNDLAYALMLTTVLAISTVIASSTGSQHEESAIVSILYDIGYWRLIAECLLFPVVEEVLFREALPRMMSSFMPMSLAISISAVAFAAIHLHSTWPPRIVLFIGAVSLSIIYARYDNLIMPIIVHVQLNVALSAYNLLQ